MTPPPEAAGSIDTARRRRRLLGADMVMFIWQNHALNACSLKRLSIDLSNELLIVEKDQREPE